MKNHCHKIFDVKIEKQKLRTLAIKLSCVSLLKIDSLVKCFSKTAAHQVNSSNLVLLHCFPFDSIKRTSWQLDSPRQDMSRKPKCWHFRKVKESLCCRTIHCITCVNGVQILNFGFSVGNLLGISFCMNSRFFGGLILCLVFTPFVLSFTYFLY